MKIGEYIKNFSSTKGFLFTYAAIGLIVVGGIFIFSNQIKISASTSAYLAKTTCEGPSAPNILGTCIEHQVQANSGAIIDIVHPPLCSGTRATRPVCQSNGQCSVTNSINCGMSGCSGGVCIGSGKSNNCCGNGKCEGVSNICKSETAATCPQDCAVTATAVATATSSAKAEVGVAEPPVPPPPPPPVPSVPAAATVTASASATGTATSTITATATKTATAEAIYAIATPTPTVSSTPNISAGEFIISGIQSGISFVLTIIIVVLVGSVIVFRIITAKD